MGHVHSRGREARQPQVSPPRQAGAAPRTTAVARARPDVTAMAVEVLRALGRVLPPTTYALDEGRIGTEGVSMAQGPCSWALLLDNGDVELLLYGRDATGGEVVVELDGDGRLGSVHPSPRRARGGLSTVGAVPLTVPH